MAFNTMSTFREGLYLKTQETVYICPGFIPETRTVYTRFTPLPDPSDRRFMLDQLAGNINVTDSDIVNGVIEQVKAGNKEGTVYGVYNQTAHGDTRSSVKLADLVLK